MASPHDFFKNPSLIFDHFQYRDPAATHNADREETRQKRTREAHQTYEEPQCEEQRELTATPHAIFKTPSLILKHFRYDGTNAAHDADLEAMQKRAREAYQKYKGQRYARRREHARAYRHQPHVKYRTYQKSAKRRNLVFTLTREQCYTMFTSACTYCKRQRKEPLTHGIDRVDNNKGYTPENTVASCARCNYMKHKYDYESFIAQCQAIAEAQRTNS